MVRHVSISPRFSYFPLASNGIGPISRNLFPYPSVFTRTGTSRVFCHHDEGTSAAGGKKLETKKEPAKGRLVIRWMIRQDMPAVLRMEEASYDYPWCEEDFLRCLRQRNCIGMSVDLFETKEDYEKWKHHSELCSIISQLKDKNKEYGGYFSEIEKAEQKADEYCRRENIRKIGESIKVVGFVIYELHKTKLHILNFAVHPEHRRIGVGSQLAERLISLLSIHRRKRIVVAIPPDRFDEASPFFTSAGFDEIKDTKVMEYNLDGKLKKKVENPAPANKPDPLANVILADTPEDLLEAVKIVTLSNDNISATLAGTLEAPLSLGLNYLKAYLGDEKAMIDVTFKLVFSEAGLELFAPIAKEIERIMDGEFTSEAGSNGEEYRDPHFLGSKKTQIIKRRERHLHHLPNLAELFLMLNHPLVQNQEGSDYTDYITNAITSIERFVMHGLSVDHRLVQVWARIGLLTHGFKLWKYDTQGGENSLFSKFGFKFDSKASKNFGARYTISKKEKPELPINDKTIIAPIRGGIIATNPKLGTVFIRNSSLVFGRDLLTEVAYFSKDSLTLEQIRSIDSEDDLTALKFKRILDPELYKKSSFVPNLKKLVSEIFVVDEAYAKWRFNPEDFDGDKNFKGDLTPGMRELVSRMENKLGEIKLDISDKPLPVLGIFSKKYPPENPFPFYGEDGMPNNHLEFTEDALTEIKDRLNGKWNKEAYPNPLWFQFIQTAVDHNAKLVLVDAPKPLESL